MKSGYLINAATDHVSPRSLHELRYESLFRIGRGFSFPCDERGGVNLNALSETARNNYLFARAMVGRELATPEVRVLKTQAA